MDDGRRKRQRRFGPAAVAPVGAGASSPADGADGGPREDVPLVQRFFVNADSDDLKDGDSVYAYLASDLYLKHIPARPDANRAPPSKLIDFRGCEERIFLQRLADGKSREDVENAVSSYGVKNPRPDACPRHGLRIRVQVRQSGENLSDIVLLFTPDYEHLCVQWVEVLRSRITPWTRRREQVLESLSHPCSENSALLLRKLRGLYEKENAEEHSSLGGRKGPEGNSSASTIIERAEANLRRLGRVRENADLIKSTTEGVINVVSGSDVQDAIARVLGGVALIGPVVSVASMCVCIAKLVAQARDDRTALRDLGKRIPKIADRLLQTVFMILQEGSIFSPPEIVDGAFSAIEGCWKLFNEAERHLLKSKRHQALRTGCVEEMKVAARKLELRLQFALRDESIAILSAHVNAHREMTENRIHCVDSRLDTLEAHSPLEEQKMTAVIAPPAPTNVVRAAIPAYEAIRNSLLSGGTTSLSDARGSGENVSSKSRGFEPRSECVESIGKIVEVPASAVDGDGGYGKTTCLLLLANDRCLREAFGYTFFIRFGSKVRDSDVVRQIAHVAQVIGRATLAEAIRGVPPGERQVSEAINLLQPSLANVRTLLILDNVWERQSEKQWVLELSALVSGDERSAIVFATRSGDLADEFAGEDRHFTVDRVTDENAARRIIETHAGLKPGALKPQSRVGFHVTELDEAAFSDTLALMLRHCNGWHLALGMCGALAKLLNFRWARIGESLRRKLAEMPSMTAKNFMRHPGLHAIVETNLEAAQDMLSDVAFTVGFTSPSDQRALEALDLKTLFSRLSILDAKRELPYYCLGPLFGLTDSCGEEIGALFEKSGLTKTRGNGRYRMLWIHDLQHASAELLCERLRYEADVTLATVHSTFLQSCAKRFGIDDGTASVIGPDSWFKVFERADAVPRGDNLATYVCNNLIRHLVESNRTVSGAVQTDLRQDESGVWKVEVECLKQLCSYEWIRARGHKFGRLGVVRDFALLWDAIDQDVTESHAGIEQDANTLRASRLGVSHALRCILKVLQLIASESFSLNDGGSDEDYSASSVAEHTMADSGLAGELYGHLAVLEFKHVDDEARPFAQQVVAMVQSSIQVGAKPPWLCPRNRCYKSVELEDERCFLEFPVGDVSVNAHALRMPERRRIPRAFQRTLSEYTQKSLAVGVAYAQLGDESPLFSAGGDGNVRVHDPHLAGEPVREWTGSGVTRHFVVSAGRGARHADDTAIAASCTEDGVVMLWGCGKWMRKREVCLTGAPWNLHTLESRNDERLACLDMTPDAKRVVSGGVGVIATAASNSSKEKRQYCVHVWTRRLSCAGAAAPGADAYSEIALSGHEERVHAVKVSRTGERIVSASKDGTVRIWRVDIDAAAASCSAGVLSPKVIFRGQVSSLALAEPVPPADEHTVYAGTMHRGEIAVVGFDSTRHQNALRSDKVRSSVACLAMLESRSSDGGGGGSSSDTSYSSYSSGWLFAGHESGVITEWDLESRSCSSVYGEPRCGAGQVSCITARFTKKDCLKNPALLFDSARRTDAAKAGVDDRAVERHADTLGDYPVCLPGSGNGCLLVSGSCDGVLCVWDTYSRACVATLHHHRRGAELRGGVSGIDVSRDGKVVASYFKDKSARVWSLQGNNEWSSWTVPAHEALVTCVVLTGDARHAITGDDKGRVRVWNSRTGFLCFRPPTRHSQKIISLAVVPCGTFRSEASDSRAASSLPSAFTLSLDGPMEREGHCREHDAIFFASRDRGGTCILWTLTDEDFWLCENGVPEAKDLCDVFSSSMELASLSKRWHEQRSQKARKAGAYTLYAQMFRDSGIPDFDCDRIECESAPEGASLQSDKAESRIECLALLNSRCSEKSSGRLVAGHRNGMITEWNLESRSCSTVYGEPRRRAEFEFAAGYEDGFVRVWRTRIGTVSGGREERANQRQPAANEVLALNACEPLRGPEPSHHHSTGAIIGSDTVSDPFTPDDYTRCLSASGDGRWLVSGSQKGVLCVWDTDSGESIATLRKDMRETMSFETINGIDVSDDGKVIALYFEGKEYAQVWSWQIGNNKWTSWPVPFQGQSSSRMANVTCLVLTADKQHVILGDENGEIHVCCARTGLLCGRPRAKGRVPRQPGAHKCDNLRIVSLAVVHGATARSGSSDSPCASCLPNCSASAVDGPADAWVASRDRGGACILWSLADMEILMLKQYVPTATDLGTVFSADIELPPHKHWHEQRSIEARSHSLIFSGGVHDSKRRYRVSADRRGMLRLAVESQNGTFVGIARAFLDSRISASGPVLGFERQEGEEKHLQVCYGLEGGAVAMLDVISKKS